jgi:hypothetical protein
MFVYGVLFWSSRVKLKPVPGTKKSVHPVRLNGLIVPEDLESFFGI